MGIKCGIVGLPNVGKSTLFNALTNAGIDAANYPFCTIDPNVGVVEVPDPRVEQIATIVKPQKIIHTTMEFVDIAGLVAGAAEGEGLGNQFLAHIRETDAIAHVVRCFENDDITHVSGKISPLADIETIHTELILADMDTLQKRIQKLEKTSKSGDKSAKLELTALSDIMQHLDAGKLANSLKNLDKHVTDYAIVSQLITAKPMMFIANVAEDGFNDNPLLSEVQKFAADSQAVVVPVCAAIEAEIMELEDTEKQELLSEMNLDEPGLARVIRAGYSLLGLETYFTAGEKEVRAWTFIQGATAPQAAGRIHSDFERGFIRAEVVAFDDFIQHQGEQGAKEAGKWRLEGKDYITQDGDVIHFRFNV